jgi:hypothetical protein
MLAITHELARYDPDYGIIAGDLNYRVDLPYEVATEHANSGKLQMLLENDQLLKFLPSLPDVFEEPITFRPTFKFDRGSDLYDTSKQQRIPSWTDRVLISIAKPRLAVGPCKRFFFETDIIRHINLKIEFPGESCFFLQDPPCTFPSRPLCKQYAHCPNIRLTDHRPVLGIWEFGIPYVNPAKFAEYERVRNVKYAELTRLAIPACMIRPQSFEIADQATLVLTNTCCVRAAWRVLALPDSVVSHPNNGTLAPSTSAQITLRVIAPFAGVQSAVIGIVGGSPIEFHFQAPYHPLRES